MRLCLILWLVILLAPFARGLPSLPEKPQFLWRSKSSLTVPNDPVVIDIDGDGSLEIVFSDIEGHLLIVDACSGKVVWKRRVETKGSLTPPVVGDFLSDGSLDIVVGSSNGYLYLVDGAKGEVLAKNAVGNKVTLTPTLIPLKTDGDYPRAGVVITDSRGNVILYEFEPVSSSGRGGSYASRAKVLWSIPVNARVTAPVSVGPVTSLKAVNVVVATSNGDLWILNRDDSQERIRFVNYTNRAIVTIPALAQLKGDGRREIVFGDLEGNLNAVYYVKGEFHRIWSKDRVLYESPRQTLIVSDLTRDGIDDIIAITKTYVFGFNGATGASLWAKGRISLLAEVNSEPAFISDKGVSPMVVFGDERGWFYLFDPLSGHKPAIVKLQKPFAKAPTVFNAGKNNRADILLISDETSLLRVLKVPVPLPPASVSWECRGGNQFRTGKLDPYYGEFLKGEIANLRSHISRYLGMAQKCAGDKNWQDVLRYSHKLLAIQPRNPVARKLYIYAYVRHHLPVIILMTVAGLGLVTFGGIKIVRLIINLRLIARANDFVENEELEEAARYYRRVLATRPNSRGVIRALGHVLARLGEFGPETVPIFETMYQMEPENPEALKALAQAYRYSGILEEKALEIYKNVLELIDDLSPFHLLIGKIYYKKGQYELAGKNIRSAIRGGQTDLDTYNTLADIYLAMSYRTRKTLPIFEKVYPKRKDDQRFLESLCDAYIDAKKTGKEVKELCLRVLEGNQDYVPAYIQLAKIYIQENNIAKAAECASHILEIEPNNKEGLLLRSQCYLIGGRKDAGALEVYKKTLEFYPENKEILKMAAHIYYESGRFDTEAAQLYRLAIRCNPSDLTILLALACIARDSGDHNLSITSIEKLIDLGQFTGDLVLQLAQAYCATHYTEPRAEKVYRTALKAFPDDKDFTILLAEVYLKAQETDLTAMFSYEKALRLVPTRKDLGCQLIKTFLGNGRYESASRLARYFLSRNPEDEEFQHLMALANLQSNKLDEAIAEYKAILRKNPSDREALVNMALAYAQEKLTTDSAAGIYQKALKLAPDNEAIHRIMACVLIKQGRITEGLEEFDRAIAASTRATDAVIGDGLALLAENPDWLEVRWYVCKKMVESGRFREAMEQLLVIFETDPAQVSNILPYYENILERDTQNVTAQLRYGVLLKIMGRTEEARTAMEQAYQLMPNSTEVQTELAELYEFLLEENEDIEVRFQLGKLYMVTGEYDKAISCFQKTAQDFRWENESTKYLGECFVQKGMLDLALQEFKKLVIDDEMKEILYDLAQRYEAKNDLVGAKQVYKQLFAADINFRNVKAKFEMLAGSTSDPIVFEKTTILNSLSDKAKRRYELLEELGRGAMGIVYRARDSELEDIVALKILPDNLSNNPEALQRFKAEARSARRLSHKNIVRIHDIGEEMGRKYISMEYVDGTDLKKLFRESGRRMPPPKFLKYMIAAARALAYAHTIGIIHRDVKPANVMITKDDEVKVTDFGIAKMMESTEATVAGALIGTPLYMSPEQVQGIPVDNRADIYSLGITMYELLTGRPPFTEGDLAYQHLHVEPKPMEGIPPELQEIVFKCLRKNREDRWETADQLADTLDTLAQTLPEP